MNLDKEEVLGVLEQVYDPEIPVDIVNLGLVYDVRVAKGRIDVKLTTTAPGCPMGNYIAAEAERMLRGIEGVEEVHVELIYDPPWHMAMMSEKGKRILD